MGKLWDRIKKDRKGYTLVELIVSFALSGMLMASAGAILIQGMNRHYQMMARLNTLSVSRIILDKVTGEIGSARNNGHSSTSVLLLDKGSTGCPAVVFTSRENRRAELTRTAGEGHPYLLLSYTTPSKREASVGWQGGEGSAGQEWYFDEKLYQGCVIESLDFAQLIGPDGSPTNVIKVSLAIKNKKTGFRYAESRCISCRQFITKEDIRRIFPETP